MAGARSRNLGGGEQLQNQPWGPKQPNQRASMDRLLLALSNDGRVAYATADGDAFNVGPVGGGAAARVEADSINDLAFLSLIHI